MSRAIERLEYSEKNVKYKNLLKFTAANALYTCQYILGVQSFNWLRLKFFDEVRSAVAASFVTLYGSLDSTSACFVIAAGLSEGYHLKSNTSSSQFVRGAFRV